MPKTMAGAHLECEAEGETGQERVAQDLAPADALLFKRLMRRREVLEKTLSSPHGFPRRPIQPLGCLLRCLYAGTIAFMEFGLATEAELWLSQHYHRSVDNMNSKLTAGRQWMQVCRSAQYRGWRRGMHALQ